MKKILILIIAISLTSCDFFFTKKEQPIEDKKVEHEFLRIPTTSYSFETTNPTENISYWFVVVQNKDGSGIMYNKFIKQDHSYFSYDEAKSVFSTDVFILNFIRIDKETYENN